MLAVIFVSELFKNSDKLYLGQAREMELGMERRVGWIETDVTVLSIIQRSAPRLFRVD